ncbi:hypothetical protein [Streptomyces sp. NPDC015350]|uniref:hypothetical protein n=1 Tax=Streptomyces sp. NPDC015350 TaxID=3364955 RepID=UPI0036FBFB6A
MTGTKHAPDVPDTSDEALMTDAPDAPDAADAPDAPDVLDTPDIPDASDAFDVPDAPDVPDEVPVTDGRDPAQVVAGMVDHVLALAATWTAWDGRPLPAGDRLYTPHKAIRRVADHMIDHLAEMEARLVGEETLPDHWHASAITTAADLAPFTGADLDEARSRLTRLARIWANRLDVLTPGLLDRSPGTGWTFRQLAFHVAESAYYADCVGALPAGGASGPAPDRTTER